MNPAPLLSRNLLDRMMWLAEEQAKKKKNGHRFKDGVLLRFAMNVRLFSGRRSYEILHSNLGKGVFPAPSTIEKKLADYHIRVKEGEINLNVLVEFFSQNADLPKVVCVSEDATAINKRREYDRKTNSIIGSSGSLNEDGFPEPGDFIVKTAEHITSHFDRFEPATVAFVVVANPICGDFPGIRIAAFGSNNKFTAVDVQRRANAIELELKKEGIEMLVYSADGDSRELKTMRQKINLGARLPKEKGGYKNTFPFFKILM